MDRFSETSNLPVLINILVLLASTVLFIAGFIFFTFFFPVILTEKIMDGPILSGKKLEDYVRQKYAYKVPTTEELEQTNMRMQLKQKEHTQQKNKKELKNQKKAKNRNNKMICKIQKWLDEEEK